MSDDTGEKHSRKKCTKGRSEEDRNKCDKRKDTHMSEMTTEGRREEGKTQEDLSAVWRRNHTGDMCAHIFCVAVCIDRSDHYGKEEGTHEDGCKEKALEKREQVCVREGEREQERQSEKKTKSTVLLWLFRHQ